MNPNHDPKTGQFTKGSGGGRLSTMSGGGTTTSGVPTNGTINQTATVTDTNGRPAGSKKVKVTFAGGEVVEVHHKGESFSFTGKTGTSLKSGEATREMRSYGKSGNEDRRLWVNRLATKIWED